MKSVKLLTVDLQFIYNGLNKTIGMNYKTCNYALLTFQADISAFQEDFYFNVLDSLERNQAKKNTIVTEIMTLPQPPKIQSGACSVFFTNNEGSDKIVSIQSAFYFSKIVSQSCYFKWSL